jgi:hypothetical protein
VEDLEHLLRVMEGPREDSLDGDGEEVLPHAYEMEELDVHPEVIEGAVLAAAELHEAEAEPALPRGVAADSVGDPSASSEPAPLLAPTSDVAVFLPNGHKITWYHRQHIFEATCCCKELHGARCRRTKSSAPAKGSREASAPQQGRPLGNILAWLEHSARFGGSVEHQLYEPTLAERVEARRAFSQGDHPMAEIILSCERLRRPGEDVEPFQCP